MQLVSFDSSRVYSVVTKDSNCEFLKIPATDYARVIEVNKIKELKNMIESRYDFQQCGILTSVDSDEPVQPPDKLRNSKCCSVSSLGILEYSSDKQML